jgi:histone-lysine N-methyltransferase SETD3
MRGAHAKANISIDAICVALLKKCIITVEMGQATDIGQRILRSELDLDAPKLIFLIIFLL